jgi:hypothetical protein
MAQTKQPRPGTRTTGAKEPAPTPPPKMTAAERRAQRAAEAKAAQRKKQQRNLLIVAAGAVILLLVAGYFIREQLINQDIGTVIPDEGGGHVNTGTPLTFNYYPPASGKHYDTPKEAGVYRTEVPEGNWVHSLEHGYVVVLVKCADGCPDVFNQLDDIYKSLPKSQFGNVKFVVTPYSHAYTDGDVKITLVAWDHEQRLDSVDKDIITRFYKKFVDKGPELVP